MCLAERSLMQALEGGCSVPIGVETKFLSEEKSVIAPNTSSCSSPSSPFYPRRLQMAATVVSVDGSHASIVSVVSKDTVTSATEAEEFGRGVAQLLIQKGARDILQEIERSKAT